MVQGHSNIQSLIYSIEYQVNSAFDMFLHSCKNMDMKISPMVKPKMVNAKTQTSESQ